MTKPLNVLIAEDQEDDMHLLLLHLRRGGYEPVWERVDTEEKFRQQLLQREWDVILADYNMPRFSGLKALEILRQTERDIPFILVSGAIGEETAVSAMKAGAHDYLLKDKLARLVPAIERELKEVNERRMLREAEEHRSKLEAQLQKAKDIAESANQRKSKVLAFVAHEFKNPLRAIATFSDILEKDSTGPLNDKQREFVQHINTACQHLQDLIDDILDIAPIEAGVIELNPQTVHIETLLEELKIIVQESAKQKNIQLDFTVDDSVDLIYADPKRLRQMLINLLSNAIKYTMENDRVCLSVINIEGRWLEFAVKDHGIGIPEQELENLFQDYYRVRNILSSQKEGLGLGLALTKKLAELHEGSIEVESQEGQGSTFRIRLPLQITGVTQKALI